MLNQLARTNLTPSAYQKGEIHQLIRDKEFENNRIFREIAEIKTSMENAASQITKKLCRVDVNRRTISTCRSYITPIRRLPLEVLAEIFSYCLPFWQEIAFHTSRVAPLVLCQVCSVWRTLAHSLPRLW
ncbi:hypothetical protein BDQ17DRAFT_1254101, partial [Cyathus striatus]